jgi:APA family basic amino acid/polyamine antiporter
MSFLFRKKSLNEAFAEIESSKLNKVLNVFDLTFFGIGAIIGAGIFALVGTASSFAGPSIILSFKFQYQEVLILILI